MKRLLAVQPRGMCGGVRRALAVVEEVLAEPERPVYVLHEIVHNTYIVENLKRRGVLFVESPEQVPPGSRLIFSAHGVSRAVEQTAAARRLCVLDATCPLVKRVHAEARAAADRGETVLLIGHRGHPEIQGTLGQLPPEAEVRVVENAAEAATLPDSYARRPLRLLTQTTLSVEETAELTALLRRRFPQLQVHENICAATRLRQQAVREAARQAECTIVLGSPHSSNSRRLREVAAKEGSRALLVDLPEELDERELAGVNTLAFSAGASVPEELEKALLQRLSELGFQQETEEEASGQPESE